MLTNLERNKPGQGEMVILELKIFEHPFQDGHLTDKIPSSVNEYSS
jgi:hypothetical protein